MNLLNFIDEVTAKGQCTFTFTHVKNTLNKSDIALRAALRRLKHRKLIAQPAKGFYVIVPPEYRILGCRPAEHFINELMQHMDYHYYIGLLSAAQYYGAAHHRPQQFQIVTDQKRRTILCDRIKIVFVTKSNIQATPLRNFPTPYGNIVLSNPEATAMDLVMYAHRCGGFDNVFAVLQDLAEKLDEHELVKLARAAAEVTWIQRLGYLLDQIKAKTLSEALFKSLGKRRLHTRVLVPGRKKNISLPQLETEAKRKVTPPLVIREASPQYLKMSSSKANRNSKWGLIINKKIEPEK